MPIQSGNDNFEMSRSRNMAHSGTEKQSRGKEYAVNVYATRDQKDDDGSLEQICQTPRGHIMVTNWVDVESESIDAHGDHRTHGTMSHGFQYRNSGPYPQEHV